MSAYFDDLEREVFRIGRVAADDETFLDLLEEVENRMIAEVSLCVGDRQFPTTSVSRPCC